MEYYLYAIVQDYNPYILLGMAALILVLFVLLLVNILQNHSLKKKYKKFMMGKDGTSLEDNLMGRISEIENLDVITRENQANIEKILEVLKSTFQKIGMVKYDAFNEMGGKLSFSLALLNQENDGFIINAMHSREGCYTYIKEIIKGNSVIVLSDEEKEALDMAMKTEI